MGVIWIRAGYPFLAHPMEGAFILSFFVKALSLHITDFLSFYPINWDLSGRKLVTVKRRERSEPS